MNTCNEGPLSRSFTTICALSLFLESVGLLPDIAATVAACPLGYPGIYAHYTSQSLGPLMTTTLASSNSSHRLDRVEFATCAALFVSLSPSNQFFVTHLYAYHDLLMRHLLRTPYKLSLSLAALRY